MKPGREAITYEQDRLEKSTKSREEQLSEAREQGLI